MSHPVRTFWPRPLRAAVFDLDGVLADTHQHHFQAWRRVAEELGFELDGSVGDAVKGVSRHAALRIVLRAGDVTLSDAEFTRTAARKNDYYRQAVAHAGPEDLLPQAKESLQLLRGAGVRIALASASQNAGALLEATGIRACFDAVVDGTVVTAAKPSPEVFLRAAAELDVEPGEGVVIEDAAAGVDGARRAGCAAIGIGDPVLLAAADLVVHDLAAIPWSFVFPGKDLA
jgi:beta-phosphoglucomutase